jgi:hypothetical protein
MDGLSLYDIRTCAAQCTVKKSVKVAGEVSKRRFWLLRDRRYP